MRIEGIGDSSGTGLSNRAFEQARAHRLAIRPTATTGTRPEQASPAIAVQDVHDSPAPSTERTEVVTAAAEVMQASVMHASTALPKPPPPVEPKKMDSDGDGWIDVNDLPYDYFQIVRRTNIKLRTEPTEHAPSVSAAAAAATAPAAGATATTTAPATGRVSASMAASIDAI